MPTIEERTAQRERELLTAQSDQRRLARVEDYIFDKSQEAFWDLMDGTLHGEKSVDASIPIEYWRVEVTEGADGDDDAPRGRGRPRKRKEKLIKPSQDIMRVENNQFCEGSTWWPGKPQIVKDWFIDRHGFQLAPGRRIYNQYKPPLNLKGDAESAWPWVDHVKKLWPDPLEHEFFFDYCAHMLQKPEEKCNVAIIMCGNQRIGKDAALLPIREAIGQWNSIGIEPDSLFSDFKPFVQTLMLIIDEVKPTKDEHQAISMYNIMKPMVAAPPNTLPLNDKHEKARYVINVMRVFATTNDPGSMYIPPEDQRMFIMHSPLQSLWHEAEGRPEYFSNLFTWMDKGGFASVQAWLYQRDIAKFNPKAAAKMTRAKEGISNTWDVPEDAVGLALERLGEPQIVFGFELLAGEFDGRDELVRLLQAPRRMGNRMLRSGYISIKPMNGVEKWKFSKGEKVLRSRVVFVKQNISNAPDLEQKILGRGNKLVSSEKENNVFSLKKEDF